MKRIWVLAVFALTTTALADLATMLYPPQAAIDRACDESHRAAKGFEFDKSLVFLEGGYLTADGTAFQTPLGTIKSICGADGRSLRKKRTPSELTAMVVLKGKLEELNDARSWAAVLTVEKLGVETARLFPDNDSVIASTSGWKADCSDGCKWVGSNYYYFNVTDPTFRAAVMDGGDLKIVVQRYGEIHSFPSPENLE